MDDKNRLQLEPMDPRLLGQRLEEIRKARGVTQQEAADHLGCSRPTYIAVEKGERPAKAEEIIKLAAFYGRPVHELVRPGEAVADLQPHLRAVAEKMKPADERELMLAIAELQRFAADYRELERMMNAPLRFNYPPEVKLADRFDVIDQAEDVAIRERQRLGLGDQPIYNLRSTLESEVGLRIFYWDLPSAIAGMFAFVADLGCCILINRKHPPERRRPSMLHEYGHLIVDRFKPGIDYLTRTGRKPANERFAEAFAMSFLMPATTIRRRFQEIVGTTNDFQVADLCRLSNFYYVSVEAMTLRLEGLGLIPKGCWRHIKESRFAVRKASALLKLPAHRETKDAFPERYKFLAVHAYEQEKITQGQLARFLRCDPVTAREIVAECLTGRMLEEDGQERNFQLEFQNSLISNVS